MILLDKKDYVNIETGETLTSEIKQRGKLIHVSDDFYLKVLFVWEVEHIKPIDYEDMLIDEYKRAVDKIRELEHELKTCKCKK